MLLTFFIGSLENIKIEKISENNWLDYLHFLRKILTFFILNFLLLLYAMIFKILNN
jgi:hypothetical protein